jgi:hypothetical protein
MTARRRSDKREFIFLTVDMPQHPTFYGISTAAKWLYVVGLTHAGRHLTDGLVPISRVVSEAEVPKKAADELVARGKWHLAGHDCIDCPDPEKGWVAIHDYLEHQRSRSEAEAEREKKQAAGRKGAAKRWGTLRVVPPAG